MNIPEEELLPFEPVVLLGERLLVVAPHPDDEAIGCGGLIAQHVDGKRQVRVVIVSDGSAAGDAGQRESESRAGLEALGTTAVDFLHFKDREIEQSATELGRRLAEIILDFRPDLICAPSPVEIHPDHVAAARALVDAIQQDDRLRTTLALTRIAFYEVSQPIRPNTLVDISAVASRKWQAIEAHGSQHELRPYLRFAQGINQYRAMTLKPHTEFAEGFWLIDAEELHVVPWGELCRRIGPHIPAESASSARVSVIVRTRDRLSLLYQAIDSIRRNTLAAEIVVVNDGGASPAAILGDDVRLVDLSQSVGRSEAMNRGVEAAAGELICFLDDDDLYHEDHLATLAARATAERGTIFYSDAVSSTWKRDDNGAFVQTERNRVFAQDYDPALLVLDNYIPLPTVMLPREAYLQAGGFDPAFDLFEDWDFLLRLSRSHRYVRIPRLTCEIRHFEGGDSLILSALSDPSRMREAKKQVWQKHRDLLTDDALFGVIERQKQRLARHADGFIEVSGRATHLEHDVTRLQREKALLLDEIQNQAALLDQERLARTAEQQRLHGEAAALRREIDSRDESLRGASSEIERVTSIARDHDSTIQQLFAEIARLNGILDTIYSSRSWKLRKFVARLSGK